MAQVLLVLLTLVLAPILVTTAAAGDESVEIDLSGYEQLRIRVGSTGDLRVDEEGRVVIERGLVGPAKVDLEVSNSGGDCGLVLVYSGNNSTVDYGGLRRQPAAFADPPHPDHLPYVFIRQGETVMVELTVHPVRFFTEAFSEEIAVYVPETEESIPLALLTLRTPGPKLLWDLRRSIGLDPVPEALFLTSAAMLVVGGIGGFAWGINRRRFGWRTPSPTQESNVRRP